MNMKSTIACMCVLLNLVMGITGCGGPFAISLGFNDPSSEMKVLLREINEARSAGYTCGPTHFEPAEPLVWNKKLAAAARYHAKDMAEHGFLRHTGSDGNDPGERISGAGYQWSVYAENISQGQQSPDEAVKAWLRSTRHCKNIMNPDVKEAGAALEKSATLRTYWTLVLAAPQE
jgi:uncharacterized protein YkwD